MPAPSACAAARWEGSVPARVPQKTATERICWGMRLSEGCRILPWIGGGPQACQVKILWRNERRPLLALSRRRPSLASWGKTLDLVVPIWTGPRGSWMIRMKSMLAALGLVALAGTALAQAEVIAERRAGLKRMGSHMEAIKPMVEAKGDVKALEPRIDDMIAFYRNLPALFPQGSGTGDIKA